MTKVTDVIAHDNCTGCASCENICPQNSIHMKPNKDGFLCPEIDINTCVDCGLCVKHCSVTHTQYLNNSSPKCYAVWATDDIREVSSSGGFFSVAANYFYKDKMDVVGAIFNDDFSVTHILSNDIKFINRIRGSKYIQSDMSGVYKEIKQSLIKGRKVLFTGMPCQVAGLYSYLGHDYKQLYTIELVCHGITSHKVFEKYRKDIFHNKDISSIEFKKKKPWGWHAGINAVFTDGSEYHKPAEDDEYLQAYLNGISKNIACANCRFNKLPRQADLTMGDFWRISDFDKTLNDNKGTSLVLVNNEHGEELFNKLKPDLQHCVEVPLSYAIRGNGSLTKPYQIHFRRNKFFRELDNISFDKLVHHCKSNTFDVGIVGLWYGLNYGSILTYYALYCVINQMGYDALMINKPEFIWRPLYVAPDTIANKFISKHCNISNLHKYNEFPILNNHCDSFIVGSDVVWNYEICGREAGNFFFLDFVDNTKKKISYASSFGGEYNVPEKERYMNQKFLQDFDAVSVRENNAENICQNKLGVKAKQVLDPVFLCDYTRFVEVANEALLDIKTPYIMTYILGGNDLQRNIILNISEKLNITTLINVVNPNNPQRVIDNLKLDAAKQPTVEEWLWYMKNTDFFIGDSFHGLCFAIIFRKQFIIAISKNMPSKDRFLTLLQICGLEDRLIYIEDNENKDYLLNQVIDYDFVYERLAPYKEESYKWLKKQLETPKIVDKRKSVNQKSDLYIIAKAAAENCHGRKIITWGNNNEFKEILKKEFNIEVSFCVDKNDSLIDNKEVFAFASIKEKNDEYYLVIPDNSYNEKDAAMIEAYGYKDGCDYIYKNHKPLVITEGNYTNKKYFDIYGNSIGGNITGNFRLILKGYNNEINLGNNIKTVVPVTVEMTGNSLFKLGSNCKFVRDFKFIFRGEVSNSNSTRIQIDDNCTFDNGIINVWKSPIGKVCTSAMLINEGCTFGENFNCSVNSGKRVIIGKDCMFSYNVAIQAGDGHSLFDVVSGKRINAISETLNNKDLIVLGNHVWVGKNSMILIGTNIGDGSIIGAGSVVKGKYLNNCTVVGNPSKIIKRNTAWSRNNASEEISEEDSTYANLTCDAEPPITGKKVLVIGGTKFMGIKLVEQLIKLGNEVTIANRGITNDKFGTNVNRIILDVSNANSIKNALERKYFDVVFDDLAFCSNYIKNLLSTITCKRYIQLSSIAVYNFRSADIKESSFEPQKEALEWCNKIVGDYGIGYGDGKRQAEIALYKEFPEVSAVTVRIPYVTKTERLYYYCRCIVKEIPMKINDISRGLTFIRDSEVGKFLPWIAAQNYTGPINLSSEGMITLQMIIEYIEQKTGKKAIFNSLNGTQSPFNERTFSLNMDKAKSLGYVTSNINDWFWKLLDEYIQKALKDK